MSPIRRFRSAWLSLVRRRCSAPSCFAHRSIRNALGSTMEVVCVPLPPSVDEVDDAKRAVLCSCGRGSGDGLGCGKDIRLFPPGPRRQALLRLSPRQTGIGLHGLSWYPFKRSFGKGNRPRFRKGPKTSGAIGGCSGIFVVFLHWQMSDAERGSERQGSKHTRRRRTKRSWVGRTTHTKKRKDETDGTERVR